MRIQYLNFFDWLKIKTNRTSGFNDYWFSCKNILQILKPLFRVVSAIKGQANRPRLKVLFEKLKNKLQKMKYAGIWTMDTSRFQIMDKRPVFLLSDIQISKNISYNFLVQKVSYRTIRFVHQPVDKPKLQLTCVC